MKHSSALVPRHQLGFTHQRLIRTDYFVMQLCLIIISIIHVVATMSLSFPDSSGENVNVTKGNSVGRLCPKGKWYFNDTSSCWPSKKQGPCPPSLIFYAQDKNYGDCECPREGDFNPVWVYDLTSSKCFKSYQQAYCKTGEWLIFDNDGEPTCVPNKCEKLQTSAGNNSHPVVLYQDMCVRVSESTVEGDCSDPYVVLISLQSGKPYCSSNTTSYGIGTTSNFKCRPGTRRDRLGKCRPLNSKVTFRPSTS